MTPYEELQNHSNEFRREIIRVSDETYIAVGYATSNVCMIIGKNALIIVDTTDSTEAAAAILQEFRKITDLPIGAIIYTHGHRDHISGATVFAEDGHPKIFASSRFEGHLQQAKHRNRPTRLLRQRSEAQFGEGLSPQDCPNIGIGPFVRPRGGLGEGYLPPTELIEGCQTVTVCGISLEFITAPGETEDQVAIWWPLKKILFCADNYYKSFPNLYAIRGTRFRDFDLWADTLDRLLQFEANILLPGHTRPLMGTRIIRETLTDYRDAIRFVVREAIKAMDLGQTPDQFARNIRLPSDLCSKPYLQEFYGTLEWSAKAYYSGIIGWFDGNPTNLFPLQKGEKARKLIALLGGTKPLLVALKAAIQRQDFQWALELADLIIDGGNDEANKAIEFKITALRALADRQRNATARNWYLVCAKRLEQCNRVSSRVP